MNPEKPTNELPDLESAVQEYLETGSPEKRKNVIQIGQAMVNYYAGIYSPGKIDETLQKAANEGFRKALTRFDPSREVLFSTYATHCIISEIRRELQNRKIFRMPEWLKRLQEDVINATEELAQGNGSLPTLEDIAEKVNIAEKGVTEAMQAGTVSLEEIDLRSIKSQRHETFKLPIEDVISIRKSLDRLTDIQKKVLSLITVNIKELSLAIEEEEQALTKSQDQYARIVENFDNVSLEKEHLEGFKIIFPEEYRQEEVLRYFEVLSDEFGLRLAKLQFRGEPKYEDSFYLRIPLEIELEGRYRGLLQLLDHMRLKEKTVRVDRVQTNRNENIPARININLILSAYFRNDGSDNVNIN